MSFEVQKDDLSIKRIQPVNQRHHSVESQTVIEQLLVIDAIGHRLELVEADERGRAAAPTDHLRCRDVVRDAIYPCTQRAPPVE